MRRDEVVNNKLNDFLERRDHERAAEKRLDTMPDAENVGTAVVSNPFRFGTTRLPNLCPCCFHRFPKDKGTKAIMAIDGNFAQFRWGHVGKGNTDMYDDMFFLHPPPDTVKFLNKLQIPTDPTVCDHNFKASSNFKPRTMEMFDETGLLLVVCR